jgi:hypothetical protein
VDTYRTDLELRLIRARRSCRYRNMVTRWVSLRSTHPTGSTDAFDRPNDIDQTRYDGIKRRNAYKGEAEVIEKHQHFRF